MSKSQNITYEKIADLAGVSHVTVSRTFSGTAPVARETRERVLEIAAKLGYQPNYLARGLRGAGTQSIGIVWNFASSATSSKTLQKLARRIYERNYNVNLINHEISIEGSRKALQELIARGVEGVIFDTVPGLLQDDEVVSLLDKFKSVVVVARQDCDIQADMIIYDRISYFREAADHFVNTGRKHPFAFISHAYENKNETAFWSQLRKRGLDIKKTDAYATYPVQLYLEDRFEEILDILKMHFERIHFDALVCSNDEVAIIAANWLMGQGLKIPGDIALVGGSGSGICPLLRPPLANVVSRADELIKSVEDMLFSRLADPKLPYRKQSLSMKFIWRESAG